MTSLPNLADVLAGVLYPVTVLYPITVTAVALTSVLARTPRRRADARQTLRLLVRRPPRRRADEQPLHPGRQQAPPD